MRTLAIVALLAMATLAAAEEKPVQLDDADAKTIADYLKASYGS